jgi:hypothetical protein
MPKQIISILIIALALTFPFKSFGQKIKMDFDPDSGKTISLTEFNQRVDRAIEVLQTKKIAQIADSDHVNIMMCLNTIFMTRENKRGPLITATPDSTIKMYASIPRFKNGRFKHLEDIVEQKKYEENIIKIYPKWTSNRGMGYYFPKLKMELYGSPHWYAWFHVLD